MNTKTIKNLASASYTRNSLDLKKINRITKHLTKVELKQFIKELKIIENKKKVHVFLANPASLAVKKQLKKLYPGKDVIFKEDKTLIAGIKIIDSDLVLEQNIKNNFNKIVNHIGL